MRMQDAVNISRWQLSFCFPEARWITLDLPEVLVFGEALTQLDKLYHLELRCPSYQGSYQYVMEANANLTRMVVKTSKGAILAFNIDSVPNLEQLRYGAGSGIYFSAMVRRFAPP